jgi:hypothetical protein
MARSKKNSLPMAPKARHVSQLQVMEESSNEDLEDEDMDEEFSEESTLDNPQDESSDITVNQVTAIHLDVSQGMEALAVESDDQEDESTPTSSPPRRSILKRVTDVGTASVGMDVACQQSTPKVRNAFDRQIECDLLYIRFVNSSEDAVIPDVMQKAADVIQEFDKVEVAWIDRKELERRLDSNPLHMRGMFVVNEFESELFNKLSDNPDCRVFGPMALINMHLATVCDHLPVKDYAILNVDLHGQVVCVHIADEDRRYELMERIATLGGLPSPSFFEKSNLVVAESQSNEICRHATKNGIDVVLPTFVDECWQRTLEGQQFDVKVMVAENKLPIFSGFCFCLSGFVSDFKTQVEKDSKEHGFVYTATLTKNKSTHLISAEASGQKFESARSWQRSGSAIHLVTKQWYSDSLRAGYALDEANYVLEAPIAKPITSNTVAKLNVPPTRPAPSTPKMTLRPDSSKKTKVTPMGTVSNIVRSSSATRANKRPPVDPNHLGMSTFNGLDFLFVGFEEEEAAHLKTMVKRHGGTVVTKPVNLARIVVNDRSRQSVDLYRVQSEAEDQRLVCHTISHKWITECVKFMRLLEIDGYLVQ